MFTALLIHQATIYRMTTGTYDDYGNAIETFTADELAVPCRIQLGGSTESIAERDTVAVDATGFFGVASNIDAYCQVEFDGAMWRVDGVPTLRNDARGPHHYEVALRLVVA